MDEEDIKRLSPDECRRHETLPKYCFYPLLLLLKHYADTNQKILEVTCTDLQNIYRNGTEHLKTDPYLRYH